MNNMFSWTNMILASALITSPATTAMAGSTVDAWKVDPLHSFVNFRIRHLGIGLVHGRFNQPEGMLLFSPDNLDASRIDMSVKVANIDTSVADRDTHLKTPDFFDETKHPVIQFKGERFRKTGADEYEIDGVMSLRGVDKPLTVKARFIGQGKDPWGGTRVGFESVFTVKRSDFGMTFMLDGIADQVELTVSIEAVKQ